MELDIDALVGPVSDEEPAGPDMYGDIDRQTIEQAFERSASGESGSGAEVDWSDIVSRIKDQGAKTRDIWLPVYLMRAAAKAGRIGLVVEASQWLARLTEERWDDVHPQLDEVGFIGRKTPCESLTRIGEFLTPLAMVPLLKHERLGSFTGADLQRFADEGTNAEGYGMFRAVLQETAPDDLRALLDGFDVLADSLRRTDSVLTEKAEGDTATNFSPTYDAIKALRAGVAILVPEDVVESSGSDETYSSDSEMSGGSSGSGGGPGFSGGIANRRDVERALDAICDYYVRNEPASPVPFALRRAKEWITLDFFAVLEDIAPGSLGEANQILKSQRAVASGTEPSVDSSSTGSSDSWDDDSWGSSGE